jgi:hypothetical protein
MKLKNLEFKPNEIITLAQRGSNPKNYQTIKYDFVPKWNREMVAFNFINEDFRKNRHQTRPIPNNIHNNKWGSNGGHGTYNHDKTDLTKMAGKETLIREKPVKEETNLNEVAVQEYMQLNFKGAELKGKQITDKKEAIEWIRQNGGSIKYNRGGNAGGRRSGLYSGGMMMREYEKAQVKMSNQNFMQPEEDDEFETLQSRIQEQETDSNIMVGGEGL